MPNGDGTGPDGKGPKTGRGLGKTSGNEKGSGLGQPRGGNGSNRFSLKNLITLLTRSSKSKQQQK